MITPSVKQITLVEFISCLYGWISVLSFINECNPISVVSSLLFSEKLRSIFNRLLATLVILDNCFIALSLVNTVRIHFFPEGDLFHVVGNTLLYPMRSTFLCCTINVAIALAVERYRAIRFASSASVPTGLLRRDWSILAILPTYLEPKHLTNQQI